MADYLGIALGVFVAVVYPILKGYVTEEFSTKAVEVPKWVKVYGALVALCLVSAFAVLAAFRAAKPDTEITFWVAVVMGFGYEASVEKIFGKPLTA
ncbi:hypothetical protein ACXC9Q_35425 [Kribbella sp. CWNU-51]